MRKLLRRSAPVVLCLGAILFAVFGSGSLRGGRAAIAPLGPSAGYFGGSPNGSVPNVSVAAQGAMAEFLSKNRIVGWNPRTGLWGGHTKPNWWQSAIAILAIVRYAERTDSLNPLYQHVLVRTYQRNIYKPYATARREFANEFMDDTAWWGLAWEEASKYELYQRHDLTDAKKFLAVAEWDARYINDQPRPCGGIEWAMHRPPDTITSAEFVALSASLAAYRKKPGVFYDPAKAGVWVQDAERALSWLRNRRLVNLKRGTVYNGVSPSCAQDIGGRMTYTEGEVADALVQLGNATHDPFYYQSAAHFLRYTLWPGSHLIRHGILQEQCEGHTDGCANLHYRLDIGSYKGLFVDAVVDWSQATGTHFFERFLRNQARAVVSYALSPPPGGGTPCATPQSCQFGLHWAPPPPGVSPMVSVGAQTSALQALSAVLPSPAARR
jgi:Glycosyl hydrolase family 76